MANYPKMHVKCSVSNCKYNKNNYCHADKLEVNAIGDGYALTSEGTACSTFVSSVDNNKTY
ncbi:protein of unknown function [Caminicella sporogenes DSM 14501]|uniref:DUF1540 domain-containing protein n=1 Tax=Caminicella sporogenes DSM 14501 TaxID=1121266 RepID=A0A1M6RIK0_9FIRM|nr:DUF1540 domain-containing protein [Caminicella sporogenes]RKD25247.1 DUF1540 domain-containing protein [Caminicella sporogenes]WIF95239.1 DUF1540 domain-containing protein [Caminicella sporogenes]SHK32260.1 protein of unknown function [Caminicella sporogenes DSM 14501]